MERKGNVPDHDVLIPVDTDMTLHVFRKFFAVEDDKGVAIDKTVRAKVRVHVNSGNSPPN